MGLDYYHVNGLRPLNGLLLMERVNNRIIMNYRDAEGGVVSCFAERMENIRRLSTYDSDGFSTGVYSPRSKGILSEYSVCPIQTIDCAALGSRGAVYPQDAHL